MVHFRYGARVSVGAVWALFVCAIPLLISTMSAHAQAKSTTGDCSLTWVSLTRDYRPGKYVYDSTYRTHGTLLKLVEDAHFTYNVESLRSSQNGTGKPGGDIAYTLRVYPNHHRALIAMVALGEKGKTAYPAGSEHSVECWFIRAIAFAPDDNVARMIYAQYLIKEKRNEEAEVQLALVARRAEDNAFTHNNAGLLYFDLKNYEKALFHSHKALQLGLGTPTLREQLMSVGKWTEPAEGTPIHAAKDPQ